jgi:hypothetical protein
VRVVTFWGRDNQIDGIVLDVLIRKHKSIRNSLGISVPVPIDSNDVVEAIFEGLLLREQSGSVTQYLPGFEEFFAPRKEELHGEWENVAERERRSRTMFAQESLDDAEVARELAAARAAIGSSSDAARFTVEALSAHGAVVSGNGVVSFDLAETPPAVREAIGMAAKTTFKARFELPVPDDVRYVSRTDPIVEGLAAHVMDTALDPLEDSVARRAGVIRTRQVQTRTTLLLLRFRYHIVTIETAGEETPLLAEDAALVAFEGAPASARWLDRDAVEALLAATPEANVHAGQAMSFVQQVVDGFDSIRPHLDEVARQRGEELLEAHRRVRQAAQMRGVRYRVEPKLPPDVLGVYVYLPAG